MQKGLDVCGFDIEEKQVPGIQVFTKLPKSEIYLVTVSTNAVHDVCKEIASVNPQSLVCIESTVLPGTCRDISMKYNLRHIVCCPHRYWADDPIKHGVRQLRVFASLNEESLVKGIDFYKKLDIPLYLAPSLEIAEMCKLVENAHRFVQIAFTEEMCRLCGDLNINYEEVMSACNTKWNCELLEPRDGIKRHIPKDIKNLVRYLTGRAGLTPLLEGAIFTDKLYKKLVVEK